MEGHNTLRHGTLVCDCVCVFSVAFHEHKDKELRSCGPMRA